MNDPIRFHQRLSVPISLLLSTIIFGVFAWFIIISQLVRKHPDVDALFYGAAWLIPFLIFLFELLFGCWKSMEITESCLTIKYMFSETVVQKTEVRNLAPENLEIFDKDGSERELRIYLHNGRKLSFAKIREGQQRLYVALHQWLSSR